MDTAAYRFDEGNLYEGGRALKLRRKGGRFELFGCFEGCPQSLRAGRLGAAAGRGESVGS